MADDGKRLTKGPNCPSSYEVAQISSGTMIGFTHLCC